MRLTVLVLLCLASPAFAQSAEPIQEKSESVAIALSVGTTLGGLMALGVADDSETMGWVGVGALYFGPSTGQWYAGKAGGLGLVLRAGAAVSMVYGFSQMLESEYDCEFDDDCTGAAEEAKAAGQRGTLFMLGGAGLWIGSTIYDVVLARRAAASWNQRHAIRVTPTFHHGPPGLVISGRF